MSLTATKDSNKRDGLPSYQDVTPGTHNKAYRVRAPADPAGSNG